MICGERESMAKLLRLVLAEALRPDGVSVIGVASTVLYGLCVIAWSTNLFPSFL